MLYESMDAAVFFPASLSKGEFISRRLDCAQVGGFNFLGPHFHLSGPLNESSCVELDMVDVKKQSESQIVCPPGGAQNSVAPVQGGDEAKCG